MCVIVGALLTQLVQGASGETSKPSVEGMMVSLLSVQGVSLVWVGCFVRVHEMSWVEAFGFRNGRGRAFLLGTMAVFLFIPLGQLLQILSFHVLTRLHLAPTAQSAVEVLRVTGFGPALVAFALATILIVPLAEELVFRGIVYPAIKHAGHPRLALWGTSALFAAIHFNLAAFLPLLLLALVLTWLYEKTDNLLASLTAHSLFNAFNLGLLFLSEEFSRGLPGQP